jgi:hypothetical protein
MANLYDKAQYIFVAGANKSGSIYGMSPIAGTTNVTLESSSTFRVGSGSRTNSNGILQDIDSHILRVDYSDLVSCPSYKFEPQRTNFMLASDYLTSGSPPNGWTVTSGSWSLVSEPNSPIGTGLSGLLRENATSSVHFTTNTAVSTLSSSTFNGPFTISVYAKRSGSGVDIRDIMMLPVAVGSAAGATYFILEGTGSILNPSVKTHVSGAFIEQLPNGWYRCSVLASTFGAGQPRIRISLTSGSGASSESYLGNNSGAVFLCAAQMESGSTSHSRREPPNISIANGTYVTAYINTSASNAATTRNADRSITLPSSSNSSAWTYFMAFKRLSPDIQSTNIEFEVISGSDTSRFVGLYNNGIAIWNSGSQGLSGSSLPIGVEHKAAIRFNNGVVTWFINGSQRFSINWPVNTFNGNVIVGDQASNTDIVHKSSFYVRVASMFNQSLSNAECISLTTTGSGTV